MSNRTQTPRGRQPEWNAPLVSLPDISQIINGDTDATQSIAVSVSGSGSLSQKSDDKSLEPVITAAELVPTTTETSSDDYSPVLVAKNAKAMEAQRPTDSPTSPEATTAVPLALSIPTIGDDGEAKSNTTAQPTTTDSSPVSHPVERATKPTPTDGPSDRKKMWTNVMICAGSIAATVAILSAFSGDASNSDPTVAADRQPLHNEPLADAVTEVPVVQLEEIEAEPIKPNTDIAAAHQTQPTAADTTPNTPRLQIESIDLATTQTNAPDSNWHQEPIEEAQGNQFTTDSVPSMPPLEQKQFAGDVRNNSESVVRGDDQSEYRHIQRYQPETESILQPPANSEYEPTGMVAPGQDNFSNIRPQSEFIENKFVSRANTARPTNDDPYYERTSPDRYQWPEGANARAIEFLSKRARR